MAWGRIDDAFDDHPKVLAVLEDENGVEAIGLWTLCFSWAHRNTRKRGKVPGLLPAHLPRRFAGPKARELAAVLVKEKLWDVVESGWMIHDFHIYLPTAETSAKKSEAGKKGAAARWGNRETAGRDGTVPSDDGTADGTANGSAMEKPGKSGSRTRRNADPAKTGNGDGTLPYLNGTVPSPSHDPMANGMASDSNAMPIPTPIPTTDTSNEVSAATASQPRTITQRSKAITDAYAAVVPLCKWPAVNGVVIRAIKTEQYADDEIRAAVLRLAGEGRSVTVDTLRVELDGLPPRRSAARPSTTDDRVATAEALKQRARERRGAVDQNQPANVIPGSVIR